MKTAAFTIVENDMVILELWLRYYSQWFDDLLVIGNNTKGEYGELEDLKAKYNFEFRRSPFLGGLDTALAFVCATQRELLQNHEWVFYSNCDEYIVPAPKKYNNLKEVMEKSTKDYLACEAFNPVQDQYELSINYAQPYLMQRRRWFKDTNYNKILLSRVPLKWTPGCHSVGGGNSDRESTSITNADLILVHLKYSDLNPRLPRDFGPSITQLDPERASNGLKNSVLIPKKIRKMF